MESAIIQYEQQLKVKSVNIDYALIRSKMYIAKDAIDAQEYASKNGGVIFHDIGIDRLIVFPESIKGFDGQLRVPIQEV